MNLAASPVILAADDDSVARSAMGRAVQACGWTARLVQSGKLREPGQIDLLFDAQFFHALEYFHCQGLLPNCGPWPWRCSTVVRCPHAI